MYATQIRREVTDPITVTGSNLVEDGPAWTKRQSPGTGLHSQNRRRYKENVKRFEMYESEQDVLTACDIKVSEHVGRMELFSTAYRLEKTRTLAMHMAMQV